MGMSSGLVQEASKSKITPPVYLDFYEFKRVPTLVYLSAPGRMVWSGCMVQLHVIGVEHGS